MQFVAKGIVIQNVERHVRVGKLCFAQAPGSRLPHAIAISIFLPFMLFHSTKAAPTIDMAPAATDT